MKTAGKDTTLRSALGPLNDALGLLELPGAAQDILRMPEREVKTRIPLKMDDGSVEVLPAYRVVWNTSRGPGKGGLRFHPDEDINTIRSLASWMTWKTAVMNLPLGGAKGGVTCDIKNMSLSEKERLCRLYVKKFADLIGPGIDVPAPDVYVDPQMISWMLDEYEAIKGCREPGVITGKPPLLGGSLGRADATARGGVYVLQAMAESMNINLAGQPVAIQGYGNAGGNAHRLVEDILEMKVVAVSDSRGGIYNSEGLDYREVKSCKEKTGTVTEFTDADLISNEELLKLDVKVLFPAALEGVITEKNADAIKADIIAELANGPTTPKADAILVEKGVKFLPDLLCNAGGVTVSYFEQVQSASNYYWPLEDVRTRLKEKMQRSYYDVEQTARDRRCVSNRTAAYILAVERVYSAMKQRGTV